MEATNPSRARYDEIGIGYDTTRRPDAYLAKRMFHHLCAEHKNGQYLDVGCGTGNYTDVLNKMGLSFTGIDPSAEMLYKAKEKNSSIQWIQGVAEQLTCDADSFDGVLVSLTIHHWKDLDKGFQEIHRVLKWNGKVVLFTTLPEQTNAYWLRHYFPRMIADSARVLPPYVHIQQAFRKAGLNIIEEETYAVKPDLEDWFLYCGKHNPEMYFREEVRRGISSFSLIAHQEEINNGLQKLREDIDSRTIEHVMKNHENELGDYLFIIGQKK